MESGRAWGASARVSDYSDAARGSGCPGAPPRRLVAPAPRSGGISAGRQAPPRARAREGGREPRPGGAGPQTGGGRCRNALQPAGAPAEQLRSFCSPRWSEARTGRAPRFLFVTGRSWKAYRLCLAKISKCKAIFAREGSLHPFKAKRCVFKRARVLSFSSSKFSKTSRDKPRI